MVRYEGTSRGSVQNSARLLSSPGNRRVGRSRSYKAESQPKSVMRGGHREEGGQGESGRTEADCW